MSLIDWSSRPKKKKTIKSLLGKSLDMLSYGDYGESAEFLDLCEELLKMEEPIVNEIHPVRRNE